MVVAGVRLCFAKNSYNVAILLCSGRYLIICLICDWHMKNRNICCYWWTGTTEMIEACFDFFLSPFNGILIPSSEIPSLWQNGTIQWLRQAVIPVNWSTYSFHLEGFSINPVTYLHICLYCHCILLLFLRCIIIQII